METQTDNKITEDSAILKSKKSDFHLVDPRNIEIEEGFNVRTDLGDIESLMKSIIMNGQEEAVIAFKKFGTEKWVMTEGHRRLIAINMARAQGHDIPYVKVMVGSRNVEDRLFSMIITGTDKKPLTLVEQAEGFKRLVAHGYEVKQLAERTAKSATHISNLLKLADAPQRVKTAIQTNQITAYTVMQVLKEVQNPDELIAIVEGAISHAKSTEPNKKRANLSNVKLEKFKTPLEKLKEASYTAFPEDHKNAKLLQDLVKVLSDKNSSVLTVKALFK